jgi:hypothetical protein
MQNEHTEAQEKSTPPAQLSLSLDKIPPQELKIFSGKESFELGQRVAQALANSTIIPQAYQNNIPNTLVALEMASRTGTSPLMVMQNLHVIQGKPSWGSPFIISMLNSCGRFSPVRYLTPKGVPVTDRTKYWCRAIATERETGEQLEGPTITWQMAQDEGWVDKKGSKWQTMPELMFRYRAAAFFGRLYAPELLIGLLTSDEIRDTVPESITEDESKDLDTAIVQMKAAKTEEDFQLIDDTFKDLAGNKQYQKFRQLYFRQNVQ